MQNNLSEENRTVRTRVHSLTEAVTELCSHFSTRSNEDEDEDDIDGEDNLLSLSLPSNGIQRMHSVPPFSTGWRDLEVFDEDTTDANCTMSNDDYERMSWVRSLERSGETNLIGLHNARVPCIIMVDDSNDSTSEDENEEQEIDNGDKHEDIEAFEYECDRTNEDDYNKYGGFDIVT